MSVFFFGFVFFSSVLGFVISGMIYKFEHQKREKQNYKLLAISEITEIPDIKEGKNS